MELLAATIEDAMPNDVTAKFCECEIDLEIQRTGPYCRGGWTLKIDYQEIDEPGNVVRDYGALLIPDNFYADDCKAEVLDRAKPSPSCYPEAVLTYDPERAVNNIGKKWFQFAARYRFDGGEISLLDMISDLVFNRGVCWSEDGSPANAIDLILTDPRLNDPHWLTILTGVDFLVRYGNERAWQLIKTYRRCELQDLSFIPPYSVTPIPGTGARFYNDGNYQVVETDVSRLRDRHPLIALTQAFSARFGYLGATLEGFDNLKCVDAVAKLDYANDDDCGEKPTGTVKVVVRVLDYHQGLRQIIHTDDGSLQFGGLGTAAIDAVANVGTKYKQIIPMAGWPAYAVGTDVFDVTRQIAPDPSYGITVLPDGSFDSTGASAKNDIDFYLGDGQDPRSEVELTLPVGMHIIRIASHRCGRASVPEHEVSEGSVYNYDNDDWRRTSSTVYQAERDGEPDGTNFFEVQVEVLEGVTETVNFRVMDLSNPIAGDTAKALTGYLLDSAGDDEPEIIAASPAMELQSFTQVRDVDSGVRGGYYSLTDHNGFFFWTDEFVGLTSPRDYQLRFDAVSATDIQAYGDNFFPNTGLNSILTATAETTISLDNEARDVIVWNKYPGARLFYSTTVRGRTITPGGAAVSGVQVIFGGTNRIATTDSAGEYSIRVYADYRDVLSTPLPGDRSDIIIYRVPGGCCATLIESLPVSIPGFGPSLEFCDEVPVLRPDHFVTSDSPYNDKRWKRRNTIRLAVGYKDANGRTFGAQPFPEPLYIPFWTEAGYVAGRPIVSWEINHQPPLEAVKFMILRQLNSQYNRYIQFVVNNVVYTRHRDSTTGALDATSYAAGDATEIHLEMDSFGFYLDENAGSTLSFVPAVGDRVTFLRDSEGNLFPGFFDYVIEGETRDPESDLQRIVIKFQAGLPELLPGTLIELYTPKLAVENEFFFEITECHDILDPGTETRRHGRGKDLSILTAAQDQVVGFQPATGYLFTGDTYYRNRKMPIRVDLEGEKTYFDRKIEDPRIYDNDPESEQQCIGRPNIYDANEKQTFHYGRVRASEAYQFNGDIRINGYSSFDPFRREDIDQDMGTLMRMQTVAEATNMIAICRYGIQPIYTSASQVYDFEGQSTVARGSDPINFGKPVKAQVGTQNPESVVLTESFIYGFDAFKQKFWRYGQNGVDIISDIGFRKEAIAIAQELKTVNESLVRVVGGFDRRYGEIYWTIAPVAGSAVEPPAGLPSGEEEPDVPSPLRDVQMIPPGIAGRTIFYCEREPRKRWEGDVSFIPEAHGLVGNASMMFRDGQLWLNGGGPINTFFGEYRASLIRVVANEKPQEVKIFDGARVICTRKVSSPRQRIEPSQMYPNGMLSRTTRNNVSGVEGDWWLPFFRDLTDPAYPGDPLRALRAGRALRGHYLILDIEIDSDETAVFSLVDIATSKSSNTR